jgi:hypothetical protein
MTRTSYLILSPDLISDLIAFNHAIQWIGGDFGATYFFLVWLTLIALLILYSTVRI